MDDSGYDDPDSWGEPTWDPDGEELPFEEDFDEDDASETVECTLCGADVYEDALQCPICGEYVSRPSSRPFSSRPVLFYVAVTLTGLAALVLALSS